MIDHKKIIASGMPCKVIKFDTDGVVTEAESFNMKNFKVEDWQIEQMARCLYDDVIEFYTTEEGQAIATQLMAEQEAKKTYRKSRSQIDIDKRKRPRKMNLQQAIHTRIKHFCNIRGLSYHHIIKTIPSLENTSTEISMDTIEKVCIALNISVADFFCSDTFRNIT